MWWCVLDNQGTVEEVLKDGMLYVVSLDAFLGTHRVKREQMSMDWELGEDCGEQLLVAEYVAFPLFSSLLCSSILSQGCARQLLSFCSILAMSRGTGQMRAV